MKKRGKKRTKSKVKKKPKVKNKPWKLPDIKLVSIIGSLLIIIIIGVVISVSIDTEGTDFTPRGGQDFRSTLGPECNDGIDNDGDGLIDYQPPAQLPFTGDPDCSSNADKTENTYEICTPEDLDNVREDLNGDYVQKCDIDLAFTNFEPIGGEFVENLQIKFRGIFDGNGYTISNYEYINPDRDYVGLFGRGDGTTLRNVNLENFNVEGNNYVGGLVGYMRGNSVHNAQTTGSINGKQYIGGLAGYIDNVGITASSSDASVNGENYTGGLVGYSLSGSFLLTSTAGEVNGGLYTGGLVSYIDSTSITNSYTMGPTSIIGDPIPDGTDGHSLGGLVGYVTSNSIIQNSFSTGDINAPGGIVIGGLVGYSIGSVISNSHSESNIYSFSEVVGGLAGAVIYGSSVENSYANGLILTENIAHYVGGLIGAINADDSDIMIRESYAAGDPVSSQGAFVGGLVGYVESEGTGNINIIQSYSTKDVNGHSWVGGLFGGTSEFTIISDSYAQGSVTANEFAGGLIGNSLMSPVINSYAMGNVTGNQYSGGLIGSAELPTILLNTYWNIETSGQGEPCGSGTCEGAIGLPTSEMQMEDTYTPEWDFEIIWDIDEEESYPYFQFPNVAI